MPKFDKKENELVTHFDKWMYLLKNLPNLRQRPEGFTERIFIRLFKIAEISQLTTEEMTKYELELKEMRDSYAARQFELKELREARMEARKAQMQAHKSQVEAIKAREKALKEGKKEGKIEGMKEGLSQGKSEIIRHMFESGISVSEIAKLTGLSEKEILELNQ